MVSSKGRGQLEGTYSDPTGRVAALARELDEWREQQAATSEILRIISNSPKDAQRAFDAIARSAAGLCKARFCQAFRFDGALIHFAAHHGLSPEAVEDICRAYPMPPSRASAVARAILSGLIEQIPDVQADSDYMRGHFASLMRFRSVTAVPMLKDSVPIGAIAVARSETGHFPERQMELLKTFANQAVIAIENVRLFDEVQARTRELHEALRQQTATADVLQVISRSPFELQTILDTLVEAAARLSDADMAGITRPDDDLHRHVVQWGGPAEADDYMLSVRHSPGRGSLVGRVLLERDVVHIPDALADPEYEMLEAQRILGFRTLLGVPLLREGIAIGVLNLWRSEVRPFTHRQITLLKIFADQAVIAIENVSLLDEIQNKSRQLENANKYMSHFIASASHDLRQPLHALNLFVSQLQTEADPAERSRLASRINDAVNSMNELFGALLDMTKLDAGILKANSTEFPVAGLFKRIETTFAGAAREKGLSFQMVGSDAWVRSDFILLERILLNLVSNAVRYTARGGIVIGCRRRGAHVRIDVYDTGPGIPQEQQVRIFGEFVQFVTPEADRHSTVGLGLGLAIVHRLAELLGHPVELSSRLGRGSRFSVSVPLVPEERRAAEIPDLAAAVTDPVHGKLIMVIDDDPLVLDGMCGILRSWGYRVRTAASLVAALEDAVKDHQSPDLIISDYRLTDGQTGIEVVGALREVFSTVVPAFLISGDTAPERLREAGRRGYHLLHKPVSPMALRTTLGRLLKTQAAES